MEPNYNLVALVPMRHSSKRVPNKNFRQLLGRPLYAYILESLSEVPEIDLVVVDTDSAVIRQGIESDFRSVAVLERPADLVDGEIPMNRIIRNDLEQVNAHTYLQTHSTNPLLKSATISSAIKTYQTREQSYDSLFSVTRLQARLWDSAATPVNHDPAVLAPTQTLDPIYVENSCMYVFDRQQFMRTGNRIGSHPMMFEIDPLEGLDIDTEQDFGNAERLIQALYD